MESDVSLPHSQQPPTCPYPKPEQSSPFSPHPISCRYISILCSHLLLGPPSGLFPSGFPHKTIYAPLMFPIRVICPAHLILLCFITRITFGEQYRSLSYSLCSLLHSPVTSSLLDPNFQIALAQ